MNYDDNIRCAKWDKVSNMTNYLNEAAYRRWLRQYQIHLANYIERLNVLRLRMDDLPKTDESDERIEPIQAAIDEIDVHLDRIFARDFSEGAKPLMESEKFFENVKVLCNLIVNLFKRPDLFMSIYEIEKNRVMKEHREFKFKEKILAVQAMIESVEAEETTAETTTETIAA